MEKGGEEERGGCDDLSVCLSASLPATGREGREKYKERERERHAQSQPGLVRLTYGWRVRGCG